ncbi:TetR/AcrR family transcriptional regulator [Gulosibacter bifidus]|uniref:TetR/AcrR family transcriptional regulator n=1 Tax=Gulosibacter bifidus TaxID=272239 RepID=A0ABW5RK27_9MICO|nr:TetR/AcrR family transcriptional regulator [Gulosibacter bifidus]
MARPNRSRELIFSAAVELAANQGISATTMDAIAEQAGVAKGSLYYNFASKDELYSAVFANMREQLLEALAQARTATDDAHTPAARAIHAIVGAFFENPNAARLAIVELIRTDRAWADDARSLRTTLVAEFAEAIRATKPDLARDFDVDAAAVALLGAVLMSSLDSIAFRTDTSKATLIASIEHLARHWLA